MLIGFFGNLEDVPGSAAYRMVCVEGIRDLRPTDASGAAWTALVPSRAESEQGQDMAVADDHTVLASGKNPAKGYKEYLKQVEDWRRAVLRSGTAGSVQESGAVVAPAEIGNSRQSLT